MGKKDVNIVDTINSIGARVDKAIKNHDDREYLECLLILYNLIEYMLRWLVFFDGLWQYANNSLSQEKFMRQWKDWKAFCERLQPYIANHVAMSMGIIDFPTYQKLENLRKERNKLVHNQIMNIQYRNIRAMEAKLIKASNLAKTLATTLNGLIKKIGIDDITKYWV